jgi:ArsR family transcriptional regulator, arsenate/arsenite/antimonite-responsive transcriptional repressor / arsenate reductase (thioredoxin)
MWTSTYRSSSIDSTIIDLSEKGAGHHGRELVIIPGASGIGSHPAGLERRASVHHALGDSHRLAIVDALHLSDLAPSELAALTGLGTNLVAFHLDVLEDVGLITRVISEGDRRRRYVSLHRDVLRAASPAVTIRADDVLFVCTANSARSQLAAALWERSTGLPARSAGRQPAGRVHPTAVGVAAAHGLDLTDRRPQGYDQLDSVPELVVSVCDRAREAGLPFQVPTLHWSVPDPVDAGPDAVEDAYDELETRVAWLAASRAVAS